MTKNTDSSPAAPVETLPETLAALSQLNTALDEALAPIINQLQQLLTQLGGRSFGSLANNQRIARELQSLFMSLGVRVVCPRPDCNEPSSVRCKKAGGAKHGSFQFEHPRNGRLISHATSIVIPPDLHLVPAPPNPRRKLKRRQG